MRRLIPWLAAIVLFCGINAMTLAQSVDADPLFDLAAIQNDPTDLAVISEEVQDDLILRKLEFTAQVLTDPVGATKPLRVAALMVLPQQGDKLPGLLWCQGGMAPANPGIPSIYARKGYACIAITIPRDKVYSWAAWDAADPKAGNMTRYAVMQMRAVTVLAQDTRVDAQRLGVAGASYGGFFATLVAGADPRIKAGVSFFSGGHHHLGTNLPQFNKLADQAAVEAWMRLLDPAWRHEKRDVPFMWTVAANDNWFYFPAVLKTYERAKSPGKVLAIMPYWTHGFPANVDQQIYDWFDVHLAQSRQPYIQPGPLRIEQKDGKLVAHWSSSTAAMKRAELVVSPNAPSASESTWLGQWVHRLHQPIFAELAADRRSASAVVPVIDPTRPMLVYGNVTDEQDVVTSTLPVLLSPPFPPQSPPGAWQGCPWGEMEPNDVAQLKGMSQSPGESDTAVVHQGNGSARVAPPTTSRKPQPVEVKLFHVPHLAHRLTLALRAQGPARIEVTVMAMPPANWEQPAVKLVMGQQPPALTKPTPVVQTVATLSDQWQVITLDVPTPSMALEGYNLRLGPVDPLGVTWWLDAVRFTPVPEASR